MRTRNWIAIGATALVLVALGVAAAWWLREPRTRAAAPVVAEAPPAGPVAGPPVGGGDAPGATASAPLPPVGTPFRLAIGDLQRRARDGDPAAMCRLAAEHAACNDIRAHLDAVAGMFEAQEDGTMTVSFDDELDRARFTERMARQADELIEASRHCDGVPPVDNRELVRQWRAAALAGSLPAMEYYVLGRAFPRNEWLSLLPELAAYRDEAEPMARRLVEAGNDQVMVMLARAYAPDRRSRGFAPLLDQAVEPDAVEALALLRLAQARATVAGNRASARTAATEVARLEADLSADQRDLAEQRFRALDAALDSRDAPSAVARRGELLAACGA